MYEPELRDWIGLSATKTDERDKIPRRLNAVSCDPDVCRVAFVRVHPLTDAAGTSRGGGLFRRARQPTTPLDARRGK